MEYMSPLSRLILIEEHAKEYHGIQYKYFKHGFISYKFESENECLWYDIFITPEKRRKGLAFEYAQEFQRELSEMGIDYLYGMVQKNYKGAEGSKAALSYFGMTKYTEDHDTIYYIKEI